MPPEGMPPEGEGCLLLRGMLPPPEGGGCLLPREGWGVTLPW